MGPEWLSEANDTVKTVFAGVQAASAWRSSPSAGDEDEQPEDAFIVPGRSTVVPCESGPAVAYGRDEVVARLANLLGKRSSGRPQLLVGAGGMGKSTIARLVAAKAHKDDPKRIIWWISAVNEDALSGGLVSVARQLGMSMTDQETIRTHPVAGLGDVIDRIWCRLDDRPPGWLLVVDNADDPDLLGPADGTGWIRKTGRGLVLVTTRNGNESCWPGWVEFTPIGPLSVEAATDVLTDLAPGAGSREDARDLATRLGCLPLALRMAGMYLRGDFVAWPTFRAYRQALDTDGVAQVIEVSPRADPQTVITQTWELSLDALEKSGLPQARPLLWLLSCYAPGSRIPVQVLTSLRRTGKGQQRIGRRHPLTALFEPARIRSTENPTQSCLDGLNGLASFSLIQRHDADGAAEHIELHPFIAEATRIALDTSNHQAITPSLVRISAVSAISAAIQDLDVGLAEHWQQFQILTPHVRELLADTARHLGRRWHRELLDCMVHCVTSYLWSRAEPRAEQLAEDALELGRDLGCAGTPAYLRLRHVHAWAIRDQDRFTEAAESLHQVLEAQRTLPGGLTRVDTLRTRHDLAWTKGRLGRWAVAEHELREVLREYRDRHQRRGQAHDDAFMLHTRCKLCWCVGKQGRWDTAERDYRLLLTDRAAILGPHHADTLDTLESLGKTLAWQGRWTDAEAEFHTLTAGRRLTLGEQHPDTLLACQLETYVAGYQARLRRDRRGQRAATARLNQILQDQESTRGVKHRNAYDSRAFLVALRGTYSPDMPWTDDLPRPLG